MEQNLWFYSTPPNLSHRSWVFLKYRLMRPTTIVGSFGGYHGHGNNHSRLFFPFVRLVCFLRKSAEFHDMQTECQRNLIHFLLPSKIASNFLLSTALFHIHSLITTWLLSCIIMLQFTLQILMFLSGCRYIPVFISLYCLSCAVKLFPCLRFLKLEPSFKNSLSWFRSLFSA